MPEFKTEQEKFWAGEFGELYINRNEGQKFIADNILLFAKIMEQTGVINSVLELGANIGLNLLAIHQLLPSAELSAVEINPQAVAELNSHEFIKSYNQSILEFSPSCTYNFTFIKGVLIHINPDELPNVYELLYQSSDRYICVAEYYSPFPVEISYRGHSDRLFKRDFAGEILDRYPDLKLLNYGFVYHRDNFPQDDLTWFLMEKSAGV